MATNSANEKLSALAQRLRLLKDRKEELEDQLKAVNKEAKDLQELQMPRLMADSEIEKFTVPGCGTVYIKDKLYVSMAPASEEDAESPFYDWAREHAPDLIKPFIHPKRLESWAKERLENMEPLPDNMLKATVVPVATLLRK